jgi:hypothetical protein
MTTMQTRFTFLFETEKPIATDVKFGIGTDHKLYIQILYVCVSKLQMLHGMNISGYLIFSGSSNL